MAFRQLFLTPGQVDAEYRAQLAEAELDELRAWLDLKKKEAVLAVLKSDLTATLSFREKEEAERIAEAQQAAFLLEKAKADAAAAAQEEGSDAGD